MFDLEVAKVAERQQGLISIEQLRGLGASRDMVRHRVDGGRWRTVHRGVFALAGVPETEAFVVRAACLAAGESAAVSHRTAVAHWSRVAIGRPVEVTTPREGGRLLSNIAVIHRSRDLVPDHVVHDSGWPVTTPVRTLVDLGQVAPLWEVKEVFERFLTRKLVTVAGARAAIVIHSRHGRRGVGALRRVVDERALGDLPADSILEAALADLCARARIPAPEYQYGIEYAGRRRYIDFAYPEQMLAIEVDGFESHGTPTAFEADRIRGNELVLLGWETLHFTWTMVVHRPTYVEHTIRTKLRKLGREMGSIAPATNPKSPVGRVRT